MHFHAQIVLCPGINDGEVLSRSLDDLLSLSPAAQSVAVVPVGLTKYRDGLYPLRTLTKEEAEDAIRRVEACNATAKKKTGFGFAYASDELYSIAGRQLPPYDDYEAFPQIENGVGLLRKFEFEFTEELAQQKKLGQDVYLDAATGESAFPFLSPLFASLGAYGIHITLHRIVNRYFGSTVTVSGLMTEGDLAAQLKNEMKSSILLLPDDTLREREDVFLDGKRIRDLESDLHAKVIPLCASDGALFVSELFEHVKEL